MSDIALSRRRFLAVGGGLLAGTLAASSGAIALLAPSRSWAVELTHFNDHQSKTLLQVCRVIYPHAALDDAAYALVVKDLDTAATDEDTRTTLTNGLADLDDASDSTWLDRDANSRLAALEAIEDTPFFKIVRSTEVVSLYSNELAYAHFGYPGPKGDAGYLHRGFNDLDWLPEPPTTASGPIPDDTRA